MSAKQIEIDTRQIEINIDIKIVEYYIKFYEKSLENLDEAYYILFPKTIKKIYDKITNLYSEYKDLLLEKQIYG